MIKFNINGGNTIEGNFVAVDPVSKLLVIGIIIFFLLYCLFFLYLIYYLNIFNN